MRRVLAAIGLLWPMCLHASSTTAWEMSTYNDFVKGTFKGVSLSRDGRISLSPKLDTLFSPSQPSVWSAVAATDGTLYLGTGHRGRIYRVDKNGAGSVVWDSPESEVFALAIAPDGTLYAGTSPNGKIYRIRNGKGEEYFAPGARYIWSLAIGRDGALYAGTGDQGKIFRITGAGQGELYYETGQNHVTALALDQQSRLLAGTEPNGILYRVTAKDKAFVLYDANLPEIRTIVPTPDGNIYVAALGGSVAQRTNAAGSASSNASGATQVSAPATSITVTSEGASAQSGMELKPKDANSAQSSAVTSTVTSASVVPAASTELMGVEKSAVYRIEPDNTVETLWSSKEENAYDIFFNNNSLLLATDGQGRIYRLGLDRRLTLLAQTDEGEMMHIFEANGNILAATGSMGKLFRLSSASGLQGSYESPVHDANTVARWGALNWRADKPGAARLAFRTRSGNSQRPDKTWSDWSEPLNDPRSASIKSPNARFIQWRAELAGSEQITPLLTSVSVSYLPQNTPPVVKSIAVTPQLAAAASGRGATAAPPAQTGVYSITVTDTGDAGQATSTGTATQTVSRGLTQQLVISWVAEDADSDRLTYNVWFRAEEDNQWKLIRSNYTENSITLEGDSFADGKYFFRVVASDKLANPGTSAREGELISPPIQFDSTPPHVAIGAPTRNGNQLQVSIEASDNASPLRRAEYSIDANSWVPLVADDGIIDGLVEHFTINLNNLAAGEHLLVVRVYDSSSNAGLSKILIH